MAHFTSFLHQNNKLPTTKVNTYRSRPMRKRVCPVYYTRFCRSSGCTSPPASALPSCVFHRFLKKPYFFCCWCCCSCLGLESESANSPDACAASFNALEDEFCTCCKHTCTASCTRTKHHPAPIKSMIPDLDNRRCTCRFGLAMAICNQ